MPRGVYFYHRERTEYHQHQGNTVTYTSMSDSTEHQVTQPQEGASLPGAPAEEQLATSAILETGENDEAPEDEEEEDSEAENLYNDDGQDEQEESESVPAPELETETAEPTENDNSPAAPEPETETAEPVTNEDATMSEGDNASIDSSKEEHVEKPKEDDDQSGSAEESSAAESSDNDDDDDDESGEDDDEENESSSSSSDGENDNEEEIEEKPEKKPETTDDTSAETSAPVDAALLERQMEYIKESKILQNEEFKKLPEQQRAHAILKLLSTNPATAMPNSDAALSSARISLPQGPSGNSIPAQRPPQMQQQQQRQPQQNNSRVDLNSPMAPRERELYEMYLQGENKITEMHNIPPKSRLFIGNLPLKNVSKEDLFRIFYRYGHILQINIKNAFGFIQYDNHQSVVNAIKAESDQINFDKKLILEVSSSNARPQFDHGDHGTNSSSTFISTSKRPFEMEGYNGDDKSRENDNNYKRARRRVAECLIFVRRTADRAYATEIFNSIKNGTGLETDMLFLKPRMELSKLINDAAFDGTWGVIIINKSQAVDIQTFYKGNHGETKFDEYVNISAPDAVAIFNNLKNSRRGGSNRQSGNQQYGYGQGSMQGGPPQGNYGNYGPSQGNYGPPQGNYGNYGPPPQGYGMPPQQGYGMPPQQGYGMPPQQGYGMPPQQGYGMPQQMNQGYGQYQGEQMPQQQQNPQLAALLGGNNSQMNQQQLLGALQNLPPNVLSNLLSAAQQQPQQNSAQPGNQKELVGLLQSAQQQQHPSGYSQSNNNNPMTNQPMRQSYGEAQNSNSGSRPDQAQSNGQGNSAAGNNVQSLLDSLAKLQK